MDASCLGHPTSVYQLTLVIPLFVGLLYLFSITAASKDRHIENVISNSAQWVSGGLKLSISQRSLISIFAPSNLKVIRQACEIVLYSKLRILKIIQDEKTIPTDMISWHYVIFISLRSSSWFRRNSDSRISEHWKQISSMIDTRFLVSCVCCGR